MSKKSEIVIRRSIEELMRVFKHLKEEASKDEVYLDIGITLRVNEDGKEVITYAGNMPPN